MTEKLNEKLNEEMDVQQETRKVSAFEALMGSDTNIEGEVYIKRLDSYFKVKALTGDHINELREECSYFEGKGKNRKKVEDTNELGKLMISAACIEPDFSDEKLLEKFKAISPADCIQKALLAGEIGKMSTEIMEISGFDEDDIEKAKN